MQLATVLSAAMLGPGFVRSTPTTDMLLAIMGGEFRMGAPTGNIGYVDVRDVAEAHCLAMEKGATGRFIVGYDRGHSDDEVTRAVARIDPRTKPRRTHGTRLRFFASLAASRSKLLATSPRL